MQGFGSMLKDYLEYYKISQTDFAERLGISTKHMNEIPNGKTIISEELMLGISLITDIDVNLIFYVETKKRIYEYLNERFNSEKEMDNFALNQMIPDNIWNNVKIDPLEREKICKDNNIPLCFLYSRLAYEGIISYKSKEYNSHKEVI